MLWFLGSTIVTTWVCYATLLKRAPSMRHSLYVLNVLAIAVSAAPLIAGPTVAETQGIGICLINLVIQNIFIAGDGRPGRALFPSTYKSSAD